MASRAVQPVSDNVVPIRRLDDLDAGYRASISIHCPNIGELEMIVRVQLMTLRDRASNACRRCCDEAYPTLAEAARIATLAALSGAKTSDLMRRAFAVESMIAAAQHLQDANR